MTRNFAKATEKKNFKINFHKLHVHNSVGIIRWIKALQPLLARFFSAVFALSAVCCQVANVIRALSQKKRVCLYETTFLPSA